MRIALLVQIQENVYTKKKHAAGLFKFRMQCSITLKQSRILLNIYIKILSEIVNH